jgi:hypothetical protein
MVGVSGDKSLGVVQWMVKPLIWKEVTQQVGIVPKKSSSHVVEET